MGLKNIAKRGGEIYILPPEEMRKLKIREEDDYRSAESIAENVEYLKGLIRENGYDKTKTITIYAEGDEYYVDEGRCRLRASIALLDEGVELAGIPAVLDEKFLSAEERLFRSYTRNEGKKFTPLESAALFKKLHSLGWTPQEIARKANLSYPYILSLLELSAAPTAIKQLVQEGTIAATEVVKTFREADSHEEAASILTLAAEEAKAEAAKAEEEAKANGKTGDAAKPKKARVTAKKIKKVKADLGITTAPVAETHVAPTGVVVTQEVIEAVSDDNLRSFFLEIAGYQFVEGQDAWTYEDLIRGWVDKARDLVGTPEAV